MGKWYTFAPCRFQGNAAFFWRDSGLYSRALQHLGHESKVILLGPGFEGDLPGIIRASAEELSSPEWWRELKLDGVIMVAWARHRDTPFVRAIAQSGTPLVEHIDGNGNAFPLFRHIETVKGYWRAERGTNKGLAVRSVFFLKNFTSFTIRTLIRHTYLKYRHLCYISVVAFTTPTALEGTQQLCSFFGGKKHGINMQLTGYPIDEHCKWDPAIPKQKRIVAIGRWDALQQKRPYVLMSSCAEIANLHKDLHIDIFGTKTDALAHWYGKLSPDIQQRIHVHGVQPGEVVAHTIQQSQISFFPSSHEGGPQALFECLACGATTVSLDSPDLPGARYAADYGHADLASKDTTEAFVAALDQGLKKWERGEYSAQQISDFWGPKTHVTKVVEKILCAVEKAAPPPAMRKNR